MQSRFNRFAVSVLLMAAAAVTLIALPGAPVQSARGVQVTIQGSTTLLPFVQAAAEEFTSKNPSISVSVRGGGSGNGLAALIDSTVQIAMASRFIKPEEVQKAAARGVYPVPIRVALDGIGAIVHPKNPVSRLTLSQLRSIYTGEVTNWKQLGGPDLKVVPVSRDTSSGTYEVWSERVMGGARVVGSALMQASNAAVADIVARTPGAIGYVGLGYVSSSVKAVQVGASAKAFIEPSLTTVQSGQYPIARELFVFTNGWPEGDVASFINFLLSSEGQRIARGEGFVPMW
ncbi:MAG TPA: phosphate ABC transporter substrate-binding protein [Firmicutes bacterium]|nr:phosphate ABC transporter substrate-binding protein [Bacillota bacterium]